MRFALFGAGIDGKNAFSRLGESKVECFIDNYKTGEYYGVPVYSLDDYKEMSEKSQILITSKKYENEIIHQLKDNGIDDFFIFSDGKILIPNDYSLRLDENAWSKHYNIEKIDEIVESVKSKRYSVQTREMLNITKPNSTVLEIGCGSGETSLVLSENKRIVTAIDYSEGSIELVSTASERLNINLNLLKCDATKDLPFVENEFDVVFQAGLLEHFEKDTRINLLRKWSKYCKTMVSMIPNAASIAYRVGKAIMERDHNWQFGLEMPQYTLYDEFYAAGLTNIHEYTIGELHSLNFLPNDHYLKNALEKMFNDIKILNEDNMGQGYLLVTIGDSR